MPRGLLITLEGLDGSGKTTQMRRLAAWLCALVPGADGEELARAVTEVVPRKEREERFAFGDSLPVGLRLLPPEGQSI